MGVREKSKTILSILEKTYPDAHCELDFSNPLELLVATVLSAQCTDKRVNEVTKTLFRKYRKAEDYIKVDPAKLEKDIRSTGFYRNKAKSIQGFCKILFEKHGGKVPKTMEDLIRLPGVGRKTANVVLGNAYGVPGITCDTHVIRLSERLGFSKEKDPVKLEFELQALIPQKDWTLASHVLIWHGRRRCYARKPDCLHCPVLKLCPYEPKTRSA